MKYIDELEDNFIVNQIKYTDYKLHNGESLNYVSPRINKIIKEILSNTNLSRVVVVLHGIALIVFIKKYCNVSYNEKIFKIIN